MERVITKMKELLESMYFIYFVFFLTGLSYFTGLYYIAFFSLVLIAFLLFITRAEIPSILAIFSLYCISWGNNLYSFESKNNPYLIMLIIMASIAFLALLYDCITNYQLYFNRLKKDGIFYCLTALFIWMLISFIWTPDTGLGGRALAEYVPCYFFYVLAKMKLSDTKKNKEYLMRSLLICALMISLEAIILSFQLKDSMSLLQIVTRKKLFMGWALSNHYMAVVNIAALGGAYLFLISKRIGQKIYIVFAESIYILMNVLTVCRGGYLGLLIAGPCCVIYYIYHVIKTKDYKWKYDLIYLAGLFVILVGYFIFFTYQGFLDAFIEYLKNIGSRLNGRDKVWWVSDKVFKEHPILGGGVGSSWYYIPYYLKWKIYNYHNYYMQMLGCFGLVGAAIFTLYLVYSFKRVLKKQAYDLIVLIFIIYFLGHGAVDTIYFNPVTMPILSVFLASIQEERTFKEIIFFRARGKYTYTSMKYYYLYKK